MHAPSRPRPHLVVAVVGALGLAVVLGAIARSQGVGRPEIDVYQWFEGWPDVVARPMWLVMQAGAVVTGAIVGSLVMGLLRGWRGALAAGLAALLAWQAARVAKDLVGRGRPADYLPFVDSRFEPVLHGGGYPSGHTCVAFAVAALIDGSLAGPWRILPWAVATGVGLGRLYFAAHLPLDVVGGAALGTSVGLLVRWAFGLDGPVRLAASGPSSAGTSGVRGSS